MSSKQVVIDVKQLSKCYQGYRKPIHRLWQSLFPSSQWYSEYWALKDINLEVRKGETIGIVGRNGAGKSTLLQIITGVLQASSGTAKTTGRISALLELGAGFNPDFTGMENARLNASIMGLSREEFHQKLPDIVEFCGLGEFLHKPVKTYSSGMFVRLAFAVAINMNPDILIIDEALAVGDVRFQAKCFRRIEQLKEQGVSILFVTHSTESVIKFCDRAVLIEDGVVKATGRPKKVVQKYLEMMFASDQPALEDEALQPLDTEFDPSIDYCQQQKSYNENEERWGDQRAQIFRYEILRNGKLSNGWVERGDQLVLRMWVYFKETIDDLIYGITLKTNDGHIVYGTNTRLQPGLSTTENKGAQISIDFTLEANLLGGDYFVSLGVAQDHDSKDAIPIDRRYDLIHLHLAPTGEAFGLADLKGQVLLASEPGLDVASNGESAAIASSIEADIRDIRSAKTNSSESKTGGRNV